MYQPLHDQSIRQTKRRYIGDLGMFWQDSSLPSKVTNDPDDDDNRDSDDDKIDDVVNDGDNGCWCINNVLAAMNDGNYRG